MSILLGARAGAAESVLMRLLARSTKVGGIFDFGYQEATILTNDAWMHAARGLPQHCLLIAYSRGLDDPTRTVKIELEDREVVLLRVIREAPLPNQSDLTRLRAEDTDRTITDHYREDGLESRPADDLTRSLMQQAAFRCRILGTFVEDDKGDLVFGKDVDAVYAAAGYVVAKPFDESLQLIVDHVELPMGERAGDLPGDEPANADLPDTDTTMVVGTLRYASSRRREQVARVHGQSTEVEVRVRPKDFVAHKTAVFGMTRAGKSNTMKVIASAVHLYSHKTGTRVGQLIFDPAGEYAYANRQDGTALSQLGDNVRIYRLGATKADRANRIRPLSLNFFDASQISGCWSLIESFFQGDTRKYIKNFLSCDPTRHPDAVDDYGDKNRLLAVRAMYYGILLNAGLDPHPGWRCPVPTNDKMRNKFSLSGDRTVYVDAKKLKSLSAQIAKVAAQQKFAGDDLEAVKMWVDPTRNGSGDQSIDGLVGMLAASGSANGYKELRSLRPYHSSESHVDFATAIYGDLARGRLVIVDLSRGSEQVLQTCADRVVNEILRRASERFRNGYRSRPMQIFLEEAHRLLHQDKFSRAATSSDPYVRLAKEAAKYKIGMIYATQEVSSVDEMILSNTANWVCAYMNNASELKKLSNYYDFADYAGQILNADDRGFVRLRTDSSPYTLPIQVKKFDLEMVNEIRAECGFGPVERSTDFAPDVAGAPDDFSDCPDPDGIFAESSRARSAEAVRGDGTGLFGEVEW